MKHEKEPSLPTEEKKKKEKPVARSRLLLHTAPEGGGREGGVSSLRLTFRKEKTSCEGEEPAPPRSIWAEKKGGKKRGRFRPSSGDERDRTSRKRGGVGPAASARLLQAASKRGKKGETGVRREERGCPASSPNHVAHHQGKGRKKKGEKRLSPRLMKRWRILADSPERKGEGGRPWYPHRWSAMPKKERGREGQAAALTAFDSLQSRDGEGEKERGEGKERG